MKKILFALALLITSATMVNAQTPQVRGNEERLNLVSKTNELEASLIRNQPKITEYILPEVLTLMKNRLVRNNQDIQALNAADKKVMMVKIQKEQGLLADFQKLSSDPVKNKKELVSKARAFIEAY